MSVDHLKKLAKNLQKLYPDFAAKHVAAPPKLSDFQELAAKAQGFPDWHAAITRKEQFVDHPKGKKRVEMIDFDQIGARLQVGLVSQVLDEYHDDGRSKRPREQLCAFFEPTHAESHDKVTHELDQYLDAMGLVGDNGPPPAYSVALIDVCQSLVMKEPGFIDGYAHWANSLYWLGRYQNIIDMNKPILDRLADMLPSGFKGRVPYSDLMNRPVHRLAHTLVLAYWKLQTPEGSKAAIALAKQMLKWWPNDNIGFRFLLSAPPQDD
ncbi:MAG: hypothetical protein V4454_08625 [Pseudomonadota bacterium]